MLQFMEVLEVLLVLVELGEVVLVELEGLVMLELLIQVAVVVGGVMQVDTQAEQEAQASLLYGHL